MVAKKFKTQPNLFKVSVLLDDKGYAQVVPVEEMEEGEEGEKGEKGDPGKGKILTIHSTILLHRCPLLVNTDTIHSFFISLGKNK